MSLPLQLAAVEEEKRVLEAERSEMRASHTTSLEDLRVQSEKDLKFINIELWLCASGDKSDLVRDSMSSSDSRSACFNRHKTDPHEKDQVNLTNDKSKQNNKSYMICLYSQSRNTKRCTCDKNG